MNGFGLMFDRCLVLGMGVFVVCMLRGREWL